MITDTAIEKLQNSAKCKKLLQIGLNKSAPTIDKYIEHKDIMLTTAIAVEIMSNELELQHDEILEPIDISSLFFGRE